MTVAPSDGSIEGLEETAVYLQDAVKRAEGFSGHRKTMEVSLRVVRREIRRAKLRQGVKPDYPSGMDVRDLVVLIGGILEPYAGTRRDPLQLLKFVYPSL